MNFDIDTSEVDRLAIDLGNAGKKATLEAAAVIAKAAVQIQNGMRQDFTGSSHARLAPYAINFTIRGLSAEVGFDKRLPQGALGNILAFGSPRSAPLADHTAALRRELPAIEKYLGEVGVNAL